MRTLGGQAYFILKMSRAHRLKITAAENKDTAFKQGGERMEMISLAQELRENSYPGRGIILGRSEDGTKAVAAYFIMGRSENSRNRIFVEDGQGIRTQAYDPSKLTDPSLIIYAPVRVLGNKTIVTNGDQTDTIYEGMDKQLTFEQSLRSREFEPDETRCSERGLQLQLFHNFCLKSDGIRRAKIKGKSAFLAADLPFFVIFTSAPNCP